MSSKELIDAALSARSSYDQAVTTLAAAEQALRNALDTMKAANLAVYEDLSVSGPCCVVDDSSSPPTVTMYTAADPDSFTATPIRVAA